MPVLPSGTYPPFANAYIILVPETTVADVIENHSQNILDFFNNIPEEKVGFRYAEGKWNIKEMLQHIIDTERIFSYRALRIARNDKTPLPGFDEKNFAAAALADQREWKDLLQEFEAVRKSTDFLLRSFHQDQLQQLGTTNGDPCSAEALSFMIFGHILHHIKLLKERYL